MIQTTTTENNQLKGCAPKHLSKDEMREWAFEKIREIGAALNDNGIVVPIEAYIQTLEAELQVTEKRLMFSERANEALFTKVIMGEGK